MATDLMDPPMTDAKGKATAAVPVKLRPEVVKAARIVASYREESMVDMLSDLLEPILAKMEAEEIAKRGKEGRKGK